MRTVAVTRAVSPGIAHCELSYRAREPIDLERARAQHAAYEATLERLGCRLLRLPAVAEWPDSVFVEDTAVVLDEIAVIARPGAASRRPETAAVADVLARFRRLERIRAPATLDGGDVLRSGRYIFVGRTRRTNADGVAQLRHCVSEFGYVVREIEVSGCLHLKSAASAVAPSTLLVDPAHVDPLAFGGLRTVSVADEESAAANVLRVQARVLLSSGCPRTRERLAAMGIAAIEVDNTELAKAEGGLTCCSLLIKSQGSEDGF